MGKKKGSLSNHRTQDVQDESQNHSSSDSHHHKQNQKSSSQAALKRRHSRDNEMRSKTSSSSNTGSESLSQHRDAKNEEDESSQSLPSQNSTSDRLSHDSDVNHKKKNLNESHDKHKQQNGAAENLPSKHENASSAAEAPSDSARHDREATPLATNANPKIVVAESDDGEISSGHSTPVAKPGYNSYEIDIGMSPATSTSTLTTVGIHSPPECNNHIDSSDQHHRRQPSKQRTDAEVEGGMPLDYRDKYYTSSKQHSLQPPHDLKFKKRSSGEFQSLKELDETSSYRTGDHQLYNFNASPNQINYHELSQVDNFSQSSFSRPGGGKKRTSVGEFYSSQESPPSPRHFLSQSVMELSEPHEQDEFYSHVSERSNLSRMSSEPYLGPQGQQYSVMYNDTKYPHPSNYRYSSGSAYSHMVPHSGTRQGNTSRNRHFKNRERVPGRRHSGENTHHLAPGDKSNSTSSLSQPRRGYVHIEKDK